MISESLQACAIPFGFQVTPTALDHLIHQMALVSLLRPPYLNFR
jgi:hypothetical protein